MTRRQLLTALIAAPLAMQAHRLPASPAYCTIPASHPAATGHSAGPNHTNHSHTGE